MKTGFWAFTILIALLVGGCGRAPEAVANTDGSGIWQVDFDAALQQAASENKYVLVNISGLSWCTWCQALEHEVFSQPEFIDYAKENLIPVLLDFNWDGTATSEEHAVQHEVLLTRYQVQGFPTVLIMNPQGRVVERDGYQPGGATNYVNFIKNVIAIDQMM